MSDTNTSPQPDAQRAFRDALGSFATGVTIATTTDAGGAPVGVTASSFNSVSVDPPLVLWSLAKSSLSRDAFANSGHFAVHILTARQEQLSNRFARSGGDKFAEVDWHAGVLGSPVLTEHAALFECSTRHQYDGGDHIIMVGEVVSFEARDEAPLLFHGGRYAERRPRPAGTTSQPGDHDSGPFGDDLLLHLISRAHLQASRPTRAMLNDMGLTLEEYTVLAALYHGAPLAVEALALRLAQAGHAADDGLLETMAAKGLVTRTEAGLDLAENGRKRFVQSLAFGNALEADLADHFSSGEIAETKRVLRRLIELTGSA